jgi:hypothetical protein
LIKLIENEHNIKLISLIRNMEEQIIRQELEKEKLRTRGVFATMQGLLLSLYSLTIAKWINPPLYAMAWKIVSLSNLERTQSTFLEEESSLETKSEWTEDPTPPATENEQ